MSLEETSRVRYVLLGLLAVIPLLPNPGWFTNADAPKWAVLAAGLLLAVLLVVVRAVRSGEKVKVGLPEHLALLSLFVVAGLLLAARAPDSRATLRAWAMIGTLAAFGILASRYLRDGDGAEGAFLVALAAGALAALVGIVGGVFGVLFGTASTFGNPSFAAEYCAPLLPLAAAVYFLGRRWTAVALGLPILVFLLLSRSRADWMGLAAAVALLAFLEVARRRSWKIRPRILTGLLLASILALPYLVQLLPVPLLGRSDTVEIRHLTREATLEMAWDHPVAGVGLEGFAAEYPDYRSPEEFRLSLRRDVSFPHNLPAQVFAEAGLPGLLFLLFFLWCTLSAGVRTLLAHPEDGIAFGALGAVVVILTSAQFSAPLRHPASALLFFLLSALLVARRPRRYVTELFRRHRRVVPVLILLVPTVVLAVLLLPHLAADRLLKQARDRGGRMDESVATLLGESIRAEPSPDALWMLAYYRTGTGKVRRARELLADLFELSPRHPRGRIELARADLEDGRPSSAREILEELVPKRPGDHVVLAMLAHAHLDAGQPSSAREILEELVPKRPGDHVVLAMLARAYLDDKQPYSARKILEELVPQRPGDDVVLVMRARARARTDDAGGALADYLAALKAAPLDSIPGHVRSFQRHLSGTSHLMALIRAGESIGYRDRDRGLRILGALGGGEAIFYRILVLVKHRNLDAAMNQLRPAVRARLVSRERLLRHPGLDPLRGREDFKALME